MPLTLRTLIYTLLMPASLFAGTMSYSFSGTIDQVLNSPPAPFGEVAVGDTFEVSYTLELDTPDQDLVEDLGTFSGAVVTYTVTMGDVLAETRLGGVNTVNANEFLATDTYAVVGLFEEFSTSLAFVDPTGTAWSPGDDLATVDLAGFPDRSFTLINGILPAVTGTLSVPEPDAFCILLGGVVAVLLGRRSCKRGEQR